MRTPPTRIHRPRRARRGFNLLEMLIALALTAALMAATMVALDASFMAYQTTTELASTHTISRMILMRILTLIRTGQGFSPFPLNPQDSLVLSNEMQFLTPTGDILSIEWIGAADVDAAHPNFDALYLTVTPPGGPTGAPQLLLEGVTQADEFGNHIEPFALEYELGRNLFRATVDLTIVPDDNMSVDLDGDNQQVIRLVASAMPRIAAYKD